MVAAKSTIRICSQDALKDLFSQIDADGNVLPCSYFPKPAGTWRRSTIRW